MRGTTQGRDPSLTPAGVVGEGRISAIWAEMLEIEEVPREADFFELGGDSLAAVRMLAAIAEATSVPVDFVDFLEEPTVAGLARVLARSGAAAEDLPEQPAAAADPDRVPISDSQERLWFLEELSSSTSAYNMPVGARVPERLDAETLREALHDLVLRHRALRCTFTSNDGRVLALYAPDMEVDLEVHDLGAEGDPELAASRITTLLAGAPFDLGRGPLLRAALLHLGPRESLVQLVLHHIVCDGCSQSVLMSELGALYCARRDGRGSGLAAAEAQYDQLASARRADLERRGLEETLAPWLERLDGAPETLDLPTDRPRPSSISYAGATRRVRLDASTVASVRSFARGARATPFATLLAVFYALLQRHSGQEDILVGTTTSGRDDQGSQGAVGLLANTVVLRGELSGEPGFTELVGRVRETVLWALAHDEAPFQEIVARLPLERDLSRHPLFQVFCAHVPEATLAIPGAVPYNALPPTSRFDLTLFVEEHPEGAVELAWEYSTALFDAASIDALIGRYTRLLEAALQDPGRPVGELPMLSEEELGQALAAAEPRTAGLPVQCMHHAFERHAGARPDAIAARFEDVALSYGELNRRANQLADRLISLGAGPGRRVAVFLEPSLELLVAVLGVLKSGAAYLPLDPEHPAERIEFVLDDAGASLLVSERRLLERLGDTVGATTQVRLDADADLLASCSPLDPSTPVTPEDVAYVIYTSGSTGRPKGVEVEHRQVARLFGATDGWFGFGSSDVWMLLHSYAFDFSVWELWGALAHGGELIVSPVWTTRAPAALAELVAEAGVTVLNATPSLFTATQDELLARAQRLALRYVIFGGEALRPATLRAWFERMPEDAPRLVNMYGITETTVHVTYRPLRARDCEQDASPIGVPIPDLGLYVLDPHGRPVPLGVAGELYVGGDGLARGYLNRPELTGERFLANPFGPGRLYRTGDVAARRADGELEFRGRIDDQVKIRGFRIELGEIERTILEHPGVSECAAVAVELGEDDTRLAAYVVGEQGSFEDADGLHEHLARKLPSYMVPSAIVPLEGIPLTRNGKIDRRALPAPSWEVRPATGAEEPTTPLEAKIAEVWREVLGVERVGPEDSFFTLGGHSLLAARVVTRVREQYSVEISVRSLFEQPTLREFASAVEAAGATGAVPASSPAGGASAATPAEGPRPLSFPQQQLLFFDQLTPGAITYNAALAWRVQGPLDLGALRQALGELFDRQQALRTVLRWAEQDTPGQVVLEDVEPELELVDLTDMPEHDREAELERRLVELAGRPFDLSRELMLRTALLRLGPDEHVLLFAPHHIAFDAWAVEVLYRELGELYAGALERRPAKLPALTLQYPDFAVWQRERLQGAVLADQLDFWRTQLAGAPTAAELPADHPRGGEQDASGATTRFTLDAGLTEELRGLCASSGVTPYMLLLAAFATLLYRESGQDDILFGGPMANRQLEGIEHLIGFFANTTVVRVRMNGNPTFGELLERVRGSVIETYEHQEVPLELVVEAVRPERRPGLHPLFQVNFRVRVGEGPQLELSGTRCTAVPVDLALARFELSLELHMLADRIEGELIYDVSRFEESTARRLVEGLGNVLAAVAASPQTRLLAIQAPEPAASGAKAPRGGVAPRQLRRPRSEA
jgi:amino acid adenylation domain-containing protein